MTDALISETIRKMIFEDEKEGEVAKLISRYPLTGPMRDWLNKLIVTRGAKYRKPETTI